MGSIGEDQIMYANMISKSENEKIATVKENKYTRSQQRFIAAANLAMNKIANEKYVKRGGVLPPQQMTIIEKRLTQEMAMMHIKRIYDSIKYEYDNMHEYIYEQMEDYRNEVNNMFQLIHKPKPMNRPITCNECGKFFNSKDYMAVIDHEQPIYNIYAVKCPGCGAEYELIQDPQTYVPYDEVEHEYKYISGGNE